ALLSLVARRFAEIERCVETLAVAVSIEVEELDGRPLAPLGRAEMTWKTRGGRVLVELDGVDLDGIRAARPGRRWRLYLPGGLTESFEAATASFARDQRSYLEASDLSSDLGPGELWWSFCGSRRSAILAARKGRVARVEGEAGSRLVE